MLILTRRVGEVIRIGDEVTVRVLAVRGGQVSLGFTAPNDVRILREEVLRDDRRAAASEPALHARPERHRVQTTPPEVPAKLHASPERTRRIASRSA